MLARNLISICAVLFATVHASAAIVVVNDFEGGTTPSGGTNNGGLQFVSGSTPGVNADAGYSSGIVTSSAGIGSASGVNFVPTVTGTYEGLFDFSWTGLKNAGIDLSNPIIYFDLQGTAGNAGGYNQIVAIANTDGTDQNSFNQGNGVDLPVGDFSGTFQIDLTNLLQYLEPTTINPNYANILLLNNKGNGSTTNIVLDNFAIQTAAVAVPEPSALLFLAAVAGAGLVVRRGRKSLV